MILSRFIKPKWQHRNPEVRKAAVEHLDDLAILNEIVQNDTAASVRQVAVRKIEDLALLEQLMTQDSDVQVREYAEQRFKQLLCGQKENSPKLETRLAQLQQLTDSNMLEYVALNGQEFELRLMAVDKIEREGLLGDIAIQDPVSQVRLRAVEKLTQKSTLERVVKASRNRDKRVSRIARDKLDALIEQIERPKRIQAECEAICTRLESLINPSQATESQLTQESAKNWEYKNAELRHLQMRWQVVADEAPVEFKTRFTKAQQAFVVAFEHYQQAKEAFRLREQALRDAKQRIYLQIEHLLTDLQAQEQLAEEEQFKQRLAHLQAQWAEIQQLSDIGEEQQWQTQFKTLCHKVEEQYKTLLDDQRIATVLEHLCQQAETELVALNPIRSEHLKELRQQWQAIDQPSSPSALISSLNSRFEHSLTALEARKNAQKEQREQAVRTIKQLLTDMEAALEHGALQKAMPLKQHAQEYLKDIVGLSPQRYKSLDSRLQAGHAKINELRSWQHWGNQVEREQLCHQVEALLSQQWTEPDTLLQVVQQAREEWKRLGSVGYAQELGDRFHQACQQLYTRYREYLCQQVEQLIEEPQDPHQTAQFIQKAQATWKHLGALGHTQALWERFSQACNQAYAPCQAHFDQQAQQRQQNLAEKQALCERLEEFVRHIDWENPPWKEIYHFYRDIEKAWQNIGPTDRKNHKEIQKRFQAILAPQLEAEQQRNCHYRLNLLFQVEAIVHHMTDIDKAIAEVKAIQAQWLVTVPSSRRVEREFWKVFRSTCDIVFEHRRQQQEAFKQERQANLAQKEALCIQVEALAQLNTEAIKTAPEQLKKYQLAWQEIGSIPKKAVDAIEKRFVAACRQVEKHYQNALLTEERQQLEQLKHKAELCHQLERADLSHEEVERVHHQWQQLPPLTDSELEASISQRFQQASSAARAGTSLSANETTLKLKETLCIRMEILAGIDSPPEATEARMAYQVARLSEAMSNGEKKFKNKRLEAQEIEQQWYLTAGDAEQSNLEARFQKACSAFYAQHAHVGADNEAVVSE